MMLGGAVLRNDTRQARDDRACAFCALPLPRRLLQTAGDTPAYCCYGCRFAAGVAQARNADEGASWILVRLGTAIFLAMNVMLMALVLYSRDVFNADHGAATDMAESFYAVLRYASLLLTTLVMTILGLPILENAISELRQRRISIDLLFVGGVAAAFAYSAVSTIRGYGSVYFETACMLLIVVTLGRWFEAAGRHRTAAAVEALRDLMPDEVTILRGNRPAIVRNADVRVGDHVLVRAGDHVPVDGVIIEHEAHIDESSITGESEPVRKSVGDEVFAGTTSLDGAVTVRATAIGDDATLGRLIDLMKRARLHKGRFERLADRLTAFFVPAVFAAAMIGAFLGHQRGGMDDAIMTLLAVALISCPCALGLATPLAVWSAMNAAAKQGALFTGGEAIERLAGVDTILFDKTGTLTTGQATVTDFALVDPNGLSPEQLLADAAGLADRTNHYVADAVIACAAQSGVRPSPVTQVRTIPGQGVIGTLNHRARTCATHEPRALARADVPISSRNRFAHDDIEAPNESVCLGNAQMMSTCEVTPLPESIGLTNASTGVAYFARAGRLRAVFHLEDAIRPETASAIEQIKKLGLRLHVLSGDRNERVARLTERLNITGDGELKPAEKLDCVRQFSVELSVAMVGDGLNDAPALAAANVGIAMGCGTDVTRASADLCLIRDDLHLVGSAIHLAKKIVRIIKQNLFWALFYNVIGIGLAMTGRLHPIFAALAMVISSALVITNSRRLANSTPPIRARSASDGFPKEPPTTPQIRARNGGRARGVDSHLSPSDGSPKEPPQVTNPVTPTEAT